LRLGGEHDPVFDAGVCALSLIEHRVDERFDVRSIQRLVEMLLGQ